MQLIFSYKSLGLHLSVSLSCDQYKRGADWRHDCGEAKYGSVKPAVFPDQL